MLRSVSRVISSGVSCDPRTFVRRALVQGLLLAIPTLTGTLACNDLSRLAGTQALPSGTSDPSIYNNAAGALTLYQAALNTVQGGVGNDVDRLGAFAEVVSHTGLLSDELQAGDLGCVGAGPNGGGCSRTAIDAEDARQLPEGQNNNTDAMYGYLQKVRGTANEAIGALVAYDSSAPPALRGHLYALEGYAELYLADLFCSGVPLSTLDFNADYTYQAGSTTDQLYRDAVAKFDTALTLSGDSTRIMNLARVGKGRALLDLGHSDSAAAAVTQVPDQFKYQIFNNWFNEGTLDAATSCMKFGATTACLTGTEADKKGANGLPYVSSNDPRTAPQGTVTNQYGAQEYSVAKYGGDAGGLFPLTVADGIEARLIRAEAALDSGDVNGWLSHLNFLRQTVTVPGQAAPLPVLSDPGTTAARVDTLFAERAAWLFLTGHRLGDMRRLVRKYGRLPFKVFPFGLYADGQTTTYNPQFFNAPVPLSESANPKFHGCLSRGA